MFTQMVPWLFSSVLFGVVLGLIIGTFVASFQARKHYSHFQAVQSQPKSGYKKVARRYLDDEEDFYTFRNR